MIELLCEEMYCLNSLCEGRNSVDLRAAIEGNMGKAWTDNKEKPSIGIVLVADFCHLLGSIKSEEDEHKVKGLLDRCKGKIIVVEEISWVSILEKYYPASLRSFKRFAMKRELGTFKINVLECFINSIEQELKIERINKDLYHEVIEDPFMADCCSNFSSVEDFYENGMGYVIMHNGAIISGASSYSYCEGFIDITIGTKEDFRQKGLALACASKLILECIEKNIYPVWDAVNMRSVSLAEKLGYRFDREYKVYSIS